MKTRHLIALSFSIVFFGCTDTESEYTEVAPESGAMTSEWQVLFDGSSFDAWRGYRQEEMAPGWQIVDGAMVQAEAQSGGDIVTKEQFSNFELEFEWLVPERGNSGVIYRATEEHGAPYETGPEYQLLDDIGWGDDQAPKNRAGSNYDIHAPSENVVKAAGEWNTGKILVNGPHVEHWLNGVKIVEYEFWTDQWKSDVAGSKWINYPDYGLRETGHISIQGDHSGVSIRNVRIRVL
jgi:hypothetical protein